MAREISRAEAYERAHEIFAQVNFNSFDYASIKESLLDYVKLYYPEDFNDYIESSEFIALLEIFAYVAELFAYRIDINAHENFITTATRKDSILRLAKLISYKASRNVPARGLVKISSVQTTERVIDSQGRNLAGRQVIWNDLNNVDWKEQFLLVMNRVLEQDFGTVAPNERVQVDDVLFELYSWNNNPLNSDGRTLFSYSASVAGVDFNMELVPSALDSNGPSEKRPERNTSFSLLYASDGLGDASDTTGFMLFTKQGQLRLKQENFDGITPNQTVDLTQANINETDIFINNVNADTREVLIVDPVGNTLPHLASEDLRFGEWIGVDLANAQNIMFNTNANRHKYEVETLDDDQARIIFGDGEFSDVPSGAFDIWYRASANSDSSIPRSTVIDQSASFSYVDQTGSVQTLTFKFSLISSLQNASASEDIEHVRKVAPSVYYTQDRMVNGRDYNTFMLQDPSILKLRSINRTFAGDSKYIAWHDPKEYYEDVKLFGDDGALYWDELNPDDGALSVVGTPESSEYILFNLLEPLLCSSDFIAVIAPKLEALGRSASDIRCSFSDGSSGLYGLPTIPSTKSNPAYSFNSALNEIAAIVAALDLATTTTSIIDIYYSVIYDEYTVDEHPTAGADSILMLRVEAKFADATLSGWDIRWRTRTLIMFSETTKFYNPNIAGPIINFDTLDSRLDEILILRANADAEQTGLLSANKHYTVVGQNLVEQNLPNAGLPDDHSLGILPADTTDDGIPDDFAQGELLNASYDYTIPIGDVVAGAAVITIPEGRSYVLGYETENIALNTPADIVVSIWVGPGADDFSELAFGTGWFNVAAEDPNKVRFQIEVTGVVDEDIIRMEVVDWVYFSRESSVDAWIPLPPTTNNITAWALETTTIEDDKRYKRHEGRFPLNFAWMHTTPRFHLVDPAASNIIDTFIITKGYYNDLVRFLENKTDNAPDEPTPLALRTAYSELLQNKMISDTVILHPGKFKVLFGERAEPELRASFKVIRPAQTTLTDNEIKVRIVSTIRTFFDINDWEFGETFFYTELSASIHAVLGTEIDSIVIVPTYNQNQFGDLFQIQSREDEIFIADVNTSNIQIVQSYTPENIRQNEEQL